MHFHIVKMNRDKEVNTNVKNIFLSMSDVKVFLTFTSLNLVLLWQLFYLFCSSIVINTVIVTAPEPLSRTESGRFDALKSDSTHHFFRNVCTKSGSLLFSQFSGCWLICLFIYLWVLTFPLENCSEFGNFVITLIQGHSPS